MFCSVTIYGLFEIADEAEAMGLVNAARKKAVSVGTHDEDDAAEAITDAREALQYLMTDAAIDLPINPMGVSLYADFLPLTTEPA